jgi:Flp pilus assembly protein TadG
MSSLSSDRKEGERGQVLVLFVLALVAIIGITGLVLDGGAAFGQRRQQQNVADTAAMAAAVTHANTTGAYAAKRSAAVSRALVISNTNGYPNGVNGTNITITDTVLTASGVRYSVSVQRPHRNSFAGLFGQPTWPVGASAAAVSGIPNAAVGAMPLIFNIKTFQTGGGHNPWLSEEYSLPGTGPEDVPQDETSFNWTVYCLASGNPCNANSNDVDDLIHQHGEEGEVNINDDIGPLNSGTHNTLFDDLAEWSGESFPVSIVDDDGNMLGWAMFSLEDSEGTSRKVIIGKFVSVRNPTGLRIVAGGGDPGNFGAYIIKLVN